MYHATKSSFSYLSTCHLKEAQVWRDVAHRGSKHLRGPIGGLHWRSSWRGSNLVVPAQRVSMAPSCPKVIQRRRQRSKVSSRRQHFNLHLKASSDHLHSHPEGICLLDFCSLRLSPIACALMRPIRGAQVWRDVSHRGSKHLRGPIWGLHWISSWRGSNLVVPA